MMVETGRRRDSRMVMVGLYAVMIQQGVSVNRAIVMFGLFMSSAMLLVMWRHQHNQSKGDSLRLIADDGEHKH
jgi:LPLT family lysophospholipid transporter-like MFS transporter